MKSDNIVSDEVLKPSETIRAKPVVKIRINHNPSPVLALKDLSDQIDALQRSVAHLTYRLSKLDYLMSRERERCWY